MGSRVILRAQDYCVVVILKMRQPNIPIPIQSAEIILTCAEVWIYEHTSEG
jgi:hypothetical protein